jgi:hypothetical protein
MIDCISNFNEDLEKTQPLPLLTADVRLEEALRRERSERIEIVEVMLFEVCGALKDGLSTVLSECRARGFALNCGNAAGRMLEDCCSELERILSAPGFSAPTDRQADVAQEVPFGETSRARKAM